MAGELILEAMFELARQRERSHKGIVDGIRSVGQSVSDVMEHRRLREQAQMQQRAEMEQARLADQRARELHADTQGRLARQHEENIKLQRATQARQDRQAAAGQLEKLQPLLDEGRVDAFNLRGSPWGIRATQDPSPQAPPRPQGPAPVDLFDLLTTRPSQQTIQNLNRAEAEAGEYQRGVQAVEEAKRNPQYNITIADDLFTSYRGGEMRDARRRDAEQVRESFAPTATADFERRSLALMEREIAEGMPREKAFAAHTQRTEGERQRIAAMDRAKLQPRGGSGQRRMTPGQDATNARGWHSQAEGTLKTYLASQGYTRHVAALDGYRAMLDDMESGNTAQIMGGLGGWVKEKSGGSAVITESEIKRYLESAIPWDERAQKSFDYWLKGGKVDKAYVKPFTEALRKSIIGRQRGVIERIGKGARATLMADPNEEVRSMADAAYIRAVTPLMSEEQLDAFIREREEGRSGLDVVSEAKPGRPKAPEPKRVDQSNARARELLGGK